jgi:CubicO group peptidase (beta-lactamase class C family)
MNKTQRASALISILILALILAGPLAISATPSATGEIDTTAIDAYIQAQMDKHALRGISIAITQGDQIVYLRSYGIAGSDRSMSPQTPMYIGSQSKSFTGLAISQLAQEGRIGLNDPVILYIPWFRVADDDATQRITINHLLHHTSGLSEAGFTVVLPEDASSEDAVRALASAQLTAPVGTKHQYFNVGYDVLASVIEQVSGIPYEQYVQEKIFDPLEMTHTYTDLEAALQDGLSQGYSRFFGFTIPARQPHRVYEVGAGYIISTAEDMAHYVIALNNDGTYQDRQILSRAGLQQLFTPVQGYGMGWYVGQDHIWHGGANETFRTSVELYPSHDLGIVLLINQGYMLDHYISGPQVLAGVQDIVLGLTPPPVSRGPSVQTIGFGMLVFALGLLTLHIFNFLKLRTWRARASEWSTLKIAWDVAVSFIIPTIILVVVFSQVQGFLGSRFNWTYQMGVMTRTLPDITVIIILGSIPDYVQGFIKLSWALARKNSK